MTKEEKKDLKIKAVETKVEKAETKESEMGIAPKVESVPEPIKVLEKKPAKKMVSVPEVTLNKVLEDMDSLKKQNELLLSIADKTRLNSYMQTHKTKELNTVKLRVINGKVVIGWMSVRDIVKKIGPGRWLEDQAIKVLYEGGTSEEMKMVDFELLKSYVVCEKIGVSTDEDGRVAYKLRRRDNLKEYNIGVQFVN